MARDRRRAHRALAAALGGALVAHAAVLGLHDALHQPQLRLRLPELAAPEPVADQPAALPDRDGLALLAEPTAVDLASVALVEVVWGGGDAAGFADTHPWPSASADNPGDTAADRGGGAEGGTITFTGRRDLEKTALRAQSWSDPDTYRAPRSDLDRRAASPEAIAREPDKAYGDRQVRTVARAGEPEASRGDRAEGTGASDGEIGTWQDADPVFDAAAGRTAERRRDGASRSSPEQAMVDRGAHAADVVRHGEAGDDTAVAAASNQRDPDPYDLTPPRAGGAADGEGVRGRHQDDGALADGSSGDGGTGASRAEVTRGKGKASIMASRTDPYLRELLRKLDAEIIFPHDLKLDLRSGRVIAQLTLHADGRISDITISTSGGFQGFDDELVRALRKVPRLGAVPDALLDGRSTLKVMVPYTFRNPMIR